MPIATFDHRPNGWFFDVWSVTITSRPWHADMSSASGGPFATVRAAIEARYERVVDLGRRAAR
jgi:hypothetical protein